jgi:probable rRNA maturation factor
MPAAIHDESGLQAYTEETLQELEALLNGSLEKLERSDAFVDVTLVDEETIHNLNRDYRGVDAVTDVLSFAQEEASDEPGYTREADEPALLGDILICVKRALDQIGRIRPLDSQGTRLSCHSRFTPFGRLRP